MPNKASSSLVHPDGTAKDHDEQNGGGSECEPAGIGTDIAGLNAANQGTKTSGGCASGCSGAVDDAAVDESAKEEAAEHEQWRDDEGAIHLVDVELIEDE